MILFHREARRRKAKGLPPLSIARSKITSKLKRSILRPFKLLFLSPVVLFLALYAAFCFGLMFLLFTTFSAVFKGQYGFSTGITGLAYIGMGVGTLGGLIVQGKFSDKIMHQRAAKRGGDVKPEDRIPLMAYFSWSIPVGMFWYGWSADAKTHWIVPIMGSTFVGIGFIFIMVSSSAYPPSNNTTDAHMITDAVHGLSRRLLWPRGCRFSARRSHCLAVHCGSISPSRRT